MDLNLANSLSKTIEAEKQATKDRRGRKDKFARADETLNPPSVLESTLPKVSSEEGKAQSRSSQRKDTLKRDSFLFPKEDHALIKSIQERAMRGGRYVNKNEVVRMALRVFSDLSDEDILNAANELPQVARGRRPEHKQSNN